MNFEFFDLLHVAIQMLMLATVEKLKVKKGKALG